MSFEIQLAAEGVETETIEVDGDLDAPYWTVRFTVDDFITRHDLTDGERVYVTLRGAEVIFDAATRVLRPVGGEPRRLRFGVLQS